MKENNTKVIAVDIDEVLLNTIQTMLKSRKHKYKWKTINFEDITNYWHMYKIKKFDFTKRWSLRFFARYLLFDHILYPNTAIQWAFEKLKEIKSHWYKLYIITARPSKLRIPLTTKKAINKYFPNIFEEIFFCNALTKNYIPKYKICEKIWAKIIIEDNLENSIECVENTWMQAILFDKPRNQEYNKTKNKEIVKVENWDQINIDLIEKIYKK